MDKLNDDDTKWLKFLFSIYPVEWNKNTDGWLKAWRIMLRSHLGDRIPME